MGSSEIVTAPTITIRIEITMATIGRRMKNLDMELLPRCSRRIRRCGRIRLRRYHHAGANFLHALGDYALAQLKSLVDAPVVAHAIAGFSIADGDLSFAIDHRNLKAALQLGHRPLRDEQRAVLRL